MGASKKTLPYLVWLAIDGRIQLSDTLESGPISHVAGEGMILTATLAIGVGAHVIGGGAHIAIGLAIAIVVFRSEVEIVPVDLGVLGIPDTNVVDRRRLVLLGDELQIHLDFATVAGLIVQMILGNPPGEAVCKHARILQSQTGGIIGRIDEFGGMVDLTIGKTIGGIAIEVLLDEAMVVSDTRTGVPNTGDPGIKVLTNRGTGQFIDADGNRLGVITSQLHGLEVLTSEATLKGGEVHVDVGDAGHGLVAGLQIGLEGLGHLAVQLVHERGGLMQENPGHATDIGSELVEVLVGDINATKEVREVLKRLGVFEHLTGVSADIATLNGPQRARSSILGYTSHSILPPFRLLRIPVDVDLDDDSLNQILVNELDIEMQDAALSFPLAVVKPTTDTTDLSLVVLGGDDL